MKRDDFDRPSTVEICNDILGIKVKLETMLHNSNLHPASRAYLQKMKDLLDQAALNAHHAESV